LPGLIEWTKQTRSARRTRSSVGADSAAIAIGFYTLLESSICNRCRGTRLRWVWYGIPTKRPASQPRTSAAATESRPLHNCVDTSAAIATSQLPPLITIN
jgi:hypothetical protein